MKIKGETIFFVGIILFVLAAFGFLFFLSRGKNSDVTTEVLVRQNSQFVGPEDAKVTLVEFGDFQCPACLAVEPTLQKLRVSYQSNVKFVFRHFPLSSHKNAFAASKAAEAAGVQSKFWKYHDLLYQHQDRWALAADPWKQFAEYATELNLDLTRFEQDYQGTATDDKVETDKKDGLSLGVPGTPTFYLNGRKVTGNYSLDFFKNQIEAELANYQ
ncbi:MAG TPA: thioredoxin domain-containing protein [Candidatus Nanoarchaeia archaeon]|nr:hypothetical protein [uncultured archaeon]